MRVPLSWLKEFIPFSFSAETLADMLTNSGLEVESIDLETPSFQGVVIGKVESTAPHPEAEKLCVAQVSDGTETFQVVCGAPNCRPGLTVAFAKIGARLKMQEEKPIKIKKGKLRGVESLGMLCSCSELDLEGDDSGILELPQGLTLGTDFASVHSDTVLDIALTPNLSHCASIIGVAREVGALLQEQVELKEKEVVEDSSLKIEDYAQVEIKNTELCARYACRVVTGVKVASSPDWLRKKVEATGCRSVNNIVDITNYVLMELGHPLHAFDRACIDGSLVVRRAHEKEKVLTLDGVARELSEETLVIADSKKVLAIAGIMGGKDSEVSEETRDIVLESAVFQSSSIHKTAKRLGMGTEASKRFERGVDFNAVLSALDKAAQLIAEVAGGKVASGYIDVKEQEAKESVVCCRYRRINEVLGTQLAISEVENIFKALELKSQLDDQQCFHVRIPSYRHDLNAEIDLIEEVARIYGYDKIPRSETRYSCSTLPHSPIYTFEQESRHSLLKEGLQEFITCDLISPKLVDCVTPRARAADQVIQVLNPTSVDQSLLRTSLLPGLLQLIKHNMDHGTRSVSGYEVGRIHFKSEEGFKELSMAGIVLSGQGAKDSWLEEPRSVDFFDMKGVVENFLESLSVKGLRFQKSELGALHPGRQASVMAGDLVVGELGEVHPNLLFKLGINQPVFFAELNLHELFQLRESETKMSPLPQYPGSERDWTLTLNESVSAQDVFDAIDKSSNRLLVGARLMTVYRSDQLGEGKKKLSFRLLYRSDKKTLPQDVVERSHQQVVDQVTKSLGEGLLVDS